jgi:uncharacterized protein
LRDVQLALAREHGLPGWTGLRAALDDLAMARCSNAERVDIVLRSRKARKSIGRRRSMAAQWASPRILSDAALPPSSRR